MKKTIYSKESLVLADWLRRQREQAGLTQRQFASILGIHHSIVGKIETGERRIDVVEFIGYCKALAANPEEAIRCVQEAASSYQVESTPPKP